MRAVKRQRRKNRLFPVELLYAGLSFGGPQWAGLYTRSRLAADPNCSRWNGKAVSSGQLASEYGFMDLDGSRPDIWRFMEEIREAGLEGDYDDYR